MNKRKMFKIIMIILDVLAIVMLLFVTKKWIDNNKNKNENEELKDYRTVKYKKFTLNIPNSVQYEGIDEYTFRLANENYNAVVEIINNENNFVFDNYDRFYNTLLEDGYIINKYYSENIIETPVLIIDNYNNMNDTKLYFFKILNPFAVKIILTNENNISENDLATIINILTNASYDYDSDKLYNYHMYAPNDNLVERNKNNQ